MKHIFIVFASAVLCLSSRNSDGIFVSPKQLATHVYGGLPSNGTVLTRNGYVLEYDKRHRVPRWVAYKVTDENMQTPKRKGAFARYRDDPDVSGEASTNEYKGLFARTRLERGHLAPYFVMGGDRDADGLRARDKDPEDMATVFQGNYMSNIAPQHREAFNGPGGLWFKLETWIRERVVVKNSSAGHDVWVFAGCIFGPGETEKAGTQNDIHVPPVFFKIVIREIKGEPKILAFLLPHHRSPHGDIEDFLVSIDVIENLTGLNFFSDLPDQKESELEKQDTFENWAGFLN
jgi:endonuclease G